MTTLLLPEQPSHRNPRTGEQTPPEAAALSLLWSTVDLTRCCCSQEHYDAWMARYGLPLGSAKVAQYLAQAAQVFEAQSYAALFREEHFDEWAARETFADRLIASAPLGEEALRTAAVASIREAHQERVPVARRPHEDG